MPDGRNVGDGDGLLLGRGPLLDHGDVELLGIRLTICETFRRRRTRSGTAPRRRPDRELPPASSRWPCGHGRDHLTGAIVRSTNRRVCAERGFGCKGRAYGVPAESVATQAKLSAGSTRRLGVGDAHKWLTRGMRGRSGTRARDLTRAFAHDRDTCRPAYELSRDLTLEYSRPFLPSSCGFTLRRRGPAGRRRSPKPPRGRLLYRTI